MRTFELRNAIADSSFGQERGGNLNPDFVECVYVIREQDALIYVGLTKSDFVSRLSWHLALEKRKSSQLSPLGRRIVNQWPNSLDWTVDLWKPKEIREKYKSDEDDLEWIIGLKEAETYLIRRFNPELNIAKK
jgi:hypothetical protein